VEAVTRDFGPTISTQEWNPRDNRIYYQVEEGDRANVYRYSPKNKKFEKLPLKEDVIRSFTIANDAGGPPIRRERLQLQPELPA